MDGKKSADALQSILHGYALMKDVAGRTEKYLQSCPNPRLRQELGKLNDYLTKANLVTLEHLGHNLNDIGLSDMGLVNNPVWFLALAPWVILGLGTVLAIFKLGPSLVEKWSPPKNMWYLVVGGAILFFVGPKLLKGLNKRGGAR